jgi:hypothetical protein
MMRVRGDIIIQRVVKLSYLVLIFIFSLIFAQNIVNAEIIYTNVSYDYNYILADEMFDEDTTRDGTTTFLVSDLIDGSSGEVSFLKWDISGIPSDANITNATLCLTTYHENPSYASNEPIQVWYSDNETWSEGDIDSMCDDGVNCDEL